MIKWLRHSILLFLLLLAILLIIGYTYVKDPALWPISSVQVTTELNHVQPEAVKKAILPYVAASFLRLK